jgi:3-dehydroquinate synthase
MKQNIFIKNNYIERIFKQISKNKNKKILIITDINIENKYSKYIKIALKNKNVIIHTIYKNEWDKNLKTITKLWKILLSNKFDRNSLVIALGGGVIGDVAGFVASTWMRGIDFIQIPTTLLAMVDSSIGGKTGFNFEYGKNLVGTFYPAKFIIEDLDFLMTLSDREYKNGLAEVIKYGVIYKSCFLREDLFSFLEMNIDKILERKDDIILKKMIELCIEAKTNIIKIDEKENNLRKILNFGHTLGHSLESLQHFIGLKHGEALALGMDFAMFLAVELGIYDVDFYFRLLDLLCKTGFKMIDWKNDIFNNNSEFVFDKIIEIMSCDKKIVAGKIDFILPFKSMGEVKIESLDLNFIRKMLIKWIKGE